MGYVGISKYYVRKPIIYAEKPMCCVRRPECFVGFPINFAGKRAADAGKTGCPGEDVNVYIGAKVRHIGVKSAEFVIFAR